MLKLQVLLLLLVSAYRLEDPEHGLVCRLVDPYAQLAISVATARGNLQLISQQEGVVFSAGHLTEVFVSIKGADLRSIDAHDRVVLVAELALGGQAPACTVVLLLLLLGVLDSMQVLLRHLLHHLFFESGALFNYLLLPG